MKARGPQTRFGRGNAAPRPKPHFRGILDEAGYQFSWWSRAGTLPPSAPINIPTDATHRASRSRVWGLGFSLAFSLNF